MNKVTYNSLTFGLTFFSPSLVDTQRVSGVEQGDSVRLELRLSSPHTWLPSAPHCTIPASLTPFPVLCLSLLSLGRPGPPGTPHPFLPTPHAFSLATVSLVSVVIGWILLYCLLIHFSPHIIEITWYLSLTDSLHLA